MRVESILSLQLIRRNIGRRGAPWLASIPSTSTTLPAASDQHIQFC